MSYIASPAQWPSWSRARVHLMGDPIARHKWHPLVTAKLPYKPASHLQWCVLQYTFPHLAHPSFWGWWSGFGWRTAMWCCFCHRGYLATPRSLMLQWKHHPEWEIALSCWPSTVWWTLPIYHLWSRPEFSVSQEVKVLQWKLVLASQMHIWWSPRCLFHC